jgi:hypothetical protein
LAGGFRLKIKCDFNKLPAASVVLTGARHYQQPAILRACRADAIQIVRNSFNVSEVETQRKDGSGWQGLRKSIRERHP